MNDFLLKIADIGITSSDNTETQTKKRFLVYMAVFMSFGGLMWGSISSYFGLYIQASIPYGYTIISFFNLLFFYKTKNFKLTRFIQVLISLFLPFIFQWMLGGFIDSGGIMLWALISLLGALTFLELRSSLIWLSIYLILTVVSGIYDDFFYQFSIDSTKDISTLFFTLNFTIISAIVAALMLFFKISNDNSRKALKKLNDSLEIKVQERTQTLNNANEELQTILSALQEKSDELEFKNKKINDSLHYAKRIQMSLLLNSELICQKLPDFVVYYNPRDVVSGDFYWLHCDSEKETMIIATADCTGHGVPGAFMSLIGDTLLTKIVKDNKVYEPDLILQQLNNGIRNALKHGNSVHRDGMDIAICVVEKKNQKIKYSGAHIPLLIATPDGNQYFKGERFSIDGLSEKTLKEIKKHEFQYEQGSTVYMFSDGFQDQFGGPKGRKYLSSRFRKFLFSLSDLSVNEQNNRIEMEFNQWKGNNPQLDDVLVVIFKV